MSIFDHKPVVIAVLRHLNVRESLTLMRTCKLCYSIGAANTRLLLRMRDMIDVMFGGGLDIMRRCTDFTEELCIFMVVREHNVVWALSQKVSVPIIAAVFKVIIMRGWFRSVLEWLGSPRSEIYRLNMVGFRRAYQCDQELRELTMKYLKSDGTVYRWLAYVDVHISVENMVAACRNYGAAINHIHEDYYNRHVEILWAAVVQNPKIVASLCIRDDELRGQIVRYCVLRNWTVLRELGGSGYNDPALTENFMQLACATSKKLKNYIASSGRF
jgi:hypothetical protein